MKSFVTKTKEFQFTNHTEWDKFTGQPLEIFEIWYESNNRGYNHLKHAFNYLCKHYGLLSFDEYTLTDSDKTITKFWIFTSYYKDNRSRYWIYQRLNKSYHLVASKDQDSPLEVHDDDLKPYEYVLKNLR